MGCGYRRYPAKLPDTITNEPEFQANWNRLLPTDLCLGEQATSAFVFEAVVKVFCPTQYLECQKFGLMIAVVSVGMLRRLRGGKKSQCRKSLNYIRSVGRI